MTTFHALDLGWGSSLKYGLGTMLGSVGRHTYGKPPSYDHLGAYMGHMGMVYGFSSMQGVYWGINSSISVVTNGGGFSLVDEVSCSAVKIAAQIFLNQTFPKISCYRASPSGHKAHMMYV